MSKHLAILDLDGDGAAYIRVSGDEQDTQRQYTSIRSFLKEHSATIPPAHWFKDEGWSRDEDTIRPEFNRLLRLVALKKIKWIVIDRLDRFGTKNGRKLVRYIDDLIDAGCKLYDVSGREWTAEDIGTLVVTVVEGDKSKGEQEDKSYRVLGGKQIWARRGDWQGGYPRLGFDVACLALATGEELWRVVYLSRGKRLKVYPDGKVEEFNDVVRTEDGEEKTIANHPKYNDATERLQAVPSRDEKKISAAVTVFTRYATEAVSFGTLAKQLNRLGLTNGAGGKFHSHHISDMLTDPLYIGYSRWNGSSQARFNQIKGGVVGQGNSAGKKQKTDKADWVMSDSRLFDPLVERPIWDACEKKLAGRKTRARAPASGRHYLSGLLYCGNCGGAMVAGPVRPGADGTEGAEYFCGTYQKAKMTGSAKDCKCLRNGLFQDVVEDYIGRYLEDAGERLTMLVRGFGQQSSTTDADGDGEADAYQEWDESLTLLLDYVRDNHPDEWAALWEEVGDAPDVSVEQAVEAYRRCFSKEATGQRLVEMKAEYDRLVDAWADLPSQRAKERAKERLLSLEQEIERLEAQRRDLAEIVERHWRRYRDLIAAIDAAQEARVELERQEDEQAVRRWAETVWGVIHRVECFFVATGRVKPAPGQPVSKLARVVVHPISGESREINVINRTPALTGMALITKLLTLHYTAAA